MASLTAKNWLKTKQSVAQKDDGRDNVSEEEKPINRWALATKTNRASYLVRKTTLKSLTVKEREQGRV